MSPVAPNVRVRPASPLTRRLLAVSAWFAVLLPVLAWWAGRDAALHLVLAGGESPASVPGPSGALARIWWVFLGSVAATLPVLWTRMITTRRRGWSASAARALVVVPLLAASVELVVPHGVVTAVLLVILMATVRPGRSARRLSHAIALGVACAIGISAAHGLLVVGLAVSVAYCTVALGFAWLDHARRAGRGLRRRWLARTPSGAPRSIHVPMPGKRSTVTGSAAEDREAAFRRAARAWRERLAIASPSPGGDSGFNAVLRIHATDGARARASLERILRRRTRRWELRACEPAQDGMTVLWYGGRVPRASRGRLLDALQGSARTLGVELR